MAPLCVACRQLLLALVSLSVFVLFLTLVTAKDNCLQIYDRQSLLNIRLSYQNFLSWDDGNNFPPPPLLSEIPACLCRTPVPRPNQRRKRRGKRSGLLVKVKLQLSLSLGLKRQAFLDGSSACNRFVSWRSLEPAYTWLTPLVAPLEELCTQRAPSPRLRRGGVNLQSLRPVGWAPRKESEPASLRIALVNARSLGNKTFILNDFFKTQKLDLLCLTETWLRAGELSPFAELLTLDCSYINSPRTTGRGGGLASVFKNCFKCKQLLEAQYSSFELNVF